MNSLFNINPAALAASEPFGERLIYSLQTTVLGLGMVFAVLALLWGVLAISKIFFEKLEASKAAKAAKSEAKEAPADVVPEETAATVSDDAGAVVAAITAAISAMLEEEGLPSSSFRVVSFRRAKNGSAWNSKQN